MKKNTLRFLVAMLCLVLAMGAATASASLAQYPITNETKTYTMAASYNKDYTTLQAFVKYEEATGIHMDVSYWPEFMQSYNLAVAGDTLPDILFTITGNKSNYEVAGKQGKLIDFMKYIDIMPDMKARMDEYPESYVSCVTDDGAMYTAPYFIKTPGTVRATGLTYNRVQAAELGYTDETMPKTVDEFVEMLLKAQEKYGKDDPEYFALRGTKNDMLKWSPDVFYGAFGPDAAASDNRINAFTIANPEHKVQYAYATEQYKLYLQFLNRLYNSGAVDPDIYATQPKVNMQKVLEGKCLFTTVTLSSYSDDLMYDADGNQLMGVLDPLASPFGKGVVYPQFFAVGRCSGIAISANQSEEDIRNLCLWVNGLYTTHESEITEGISGLLPFLGIRGVDWYLTEDNTVVTNFTDGGASIGFSSAPCCIMPYMNADLPGNRGAYMWQLKKMDITARYGMNAEDAMPMEYLTFTEEENDVKGMYEAEITSMWTENAAKFIIGTLNFDTDWDNYVKNLNGMGLEELVQVYQNAYDRYIAALRK